MLIENYKGIDINHDAKKDEFFTNVVINIKSNNKKEFICSGRLQKIRDDIDKFLNTATKKPVLKKAWIKGRYESSAYEPCEIILYNMISKTVIVKIKDGKEKTIRISDYGNYNDEKLLISCKENDAIIKNLNEKQKEIEKINKEVSCSSGKLLPLKLEHFE